MKSVSDILKSHMEAVKAKVQMRMAEQKRNATGRSSASLVVQISGDTASLFGSSSFKSMERGRGAGKVPRNFKTIIKEWIKAKGISVRPKQSVRASKISAQERGLNSLAGAIAHTIMKKGTKLNREHGYNDIYTSVINEELKLMKEELGGMAGEEFITINKLL